MLREGRGRHADKFREFAGWNVFLADPAEDGQQIGIGQQPEGFGCFLKGLVVDLLMRQFDRFL